MPRTQLTYCETITSSSYEKALEVVMQHAAFALGDMGVPDVEVYVYPPAPGSQVHEYEFTLRYRMEE